MSDHEPTGLDPSEHHEELIEEADEPAVIAAEELEAQQVEHEEADELARLDAAKARADARKRDDRDGHG